MTKTLQKIFLIIFFMIFIVANSFAQEILEGKATFDWVLKTQDEREQKIEEIRDLLFSEGTVLKYNKKIFKSDNADFWKNKSYINDYELVKSGIKEDNDRNLCGFYWKKILIAYGIQYKKSPENVYYYDSLGNLRWVDKVSLSYPNYPYWSYQYNRSGKLVAAYYNISGDDQYVYTPDKIFRGRWYKDKLYSKDAKVVLTRSTW